jgi:bifunctional non-homologous end joining protein LigD
MRLSRRDDPFDSDQHIFELKVDGVRSLAHVEANSCELISRNGNPLRGFDDLTLWVGKHLNVESAVLDGEIACIDHDGRPSFRNLLLRRQRSAFVAFDLLYLNGADLRILPLVERKTILKALIHRRLSRVLYLGHVEEEGELLFEQIVAMDLEGIVCKLKDSPYRVTDKPSRHWIMVENSRYRCEKT